MTYHAPTLTDAIRREASKRLGQLEAKHDIKVVFAVESGSRAWGFQSPDSDYDVRGFFVRPAGAYLGLVPPPDVINPGIDELWDIELWDLGKALRLLVKGNATVAEWLQSPLIYDESGPVPYKLRDLMKRHSTPQKSACHYYGLGNTCYKGEISHKPTAMELADMATHGLVPKGITTVNYKKYLYALRAAFCIAWIDRYIEVPPMTMPQLMSHDIIPPDVRDITQTLLTKKATMGEFELGPRIAVLDAFIEDRLAWVKERGLDSLPPSQAFFNEANALLLEAVGV